MTYVPRRNDGLYYYIIILYVIEMSEFSWRRSVIKEVGRSWNELRFLAADRSGKDS